MEKITIIGAGLSGCLLAILLGRRGYSIELIESRADIRQAGSDLSRSINLALSCRGITGLQAAGLMQAVEKRMVPMRARAIHNQNGHIQLQAFGRHPDEYINAIQRSDLNCLLLNHIQKQPNITCSFQQKLVDLDLYKKTITLKQEDGTIKIFPYQRLIGADGAASKVREAMVKQGVIQAKRDFLSHGYKELTIGQVHAERFFHEHLHLWPRERFMLLGNPNVDHSITGSLFMSNEGKNSFAELDNEIKINTFFQRVFPDAYLTMPNLVEEFITHPVGKLSTIKAAPWYFEDHCLLIGDAAHGIVPFFGQGMNCAFEDCRLFNDTLAHYHDDWPLVLRKFYEDRKRHTDAIAQMAMDNYHEIEIDICHQSFNVKKQLNLELMHHYPERYISKHVLVMFTNTPYAKAQAIGDIQTELLENIYQKYRQITDIDWGEMDKMMLQYDKKVAELKQD